MTSTRRIRYTLSAAALGILLSVSPVVRAQTHGDPVEFTAFAVNMGSIVRGSTANLIITVNRWSTQAERDSVFTSLREKGPEGLFNVLKDLKRVGSLRTAQTVGYDLRLAISDPLPEGGTRVMLATDRPLSFYEATNRPVTYDYPITVIDMQLKPDGTGEGTMSLAARIIPAGKNIVVENYDTQPIKLNRIETRKLKT